MNHLLLHHKKIQVIIFVLSILSIAIFNIGCLKKESTNINNSYSPDEVNIAANECGSYYTYYYYPQISQVIQGNREGELLGFLWDENNSKQLEALYLINPFIQKAIKVSEPKEGYIANAALNNKWIIFTEKTHYKWRIIAINRSTNKKITVDEGTYFKEAGLDYPSLSVENDNLVYNISEKKDKIILSKIILYNLGNKSKKTLHVFEGEENYFGAPSINANTIVWHRGEWTSEMNAEVYYYNIKDKELRQISNSKPAITPCIWGDYIVWNEYESNNPETKNIVLYDLATDKRTKLTNAVKGDRREYWGPTIAHGIVSWNYNTKSKLELYTAKLKTKKVFDIYGEQVKVLGSWFTWHDKQKGNGTCMFSLVDAFPALDLSGSSKETPLTKSVIPIDNKIEFNQLKSFNPPQIASIYYEALKQQRYDIVSFLLADNDAYNKTKFLKEICSGEDEIKSFAISNDYMIAGNKAYICLLSEITKQKKFEKAENLHMTNVNGIWKMDILAKQ